MNMDNIEQDIKVLDKVLNSPIFLEKFPSISRVWITQFGKNIDVVLNPSDTGQYWSNRENIYSHIHNLRNMAGVKSRIQIYP
jgi:hypothetical protein